MPYANDIDLEDPLKDENEDNISEKQLLKIPNQIVVLSDVCYGFYYYTFKRIKHKCNILIIIIII